MTGNNNSRFTLDMTPELRTRLKIAAAHKGVTMREYCLSAIEQQLAREEPGLLAFGDFNLGAVDMNGFPVIKVNALEFARNAKVRIGTSHAGQHLLKPQECCKRLCNWENRGDTMLTRTKAREAMKVSYSRGKCRNYFDL